MIFYNMALIIVESPTKARTFNRILKASEDKKDYFVFATMGHIRDLPKEKMAINYENNFKPTYQIIKNKEKIVAALKKLAEKNKEIIFATDPDREGEAISYHAAYLLGFIEEKWPEIVFKKDIPPKRIVFHEITKNALQEALGKPETIRISLVKAQQTRRILDRIVGYELSPLLWKKMGKNWLSAGRVQTVALRLIVEREKEIGVFKVEDYYQIEGDFGLKAKLVAKDDIPYEQKFIFHLFAGDYQYSKTTITQKSLGKLKQDIETDKLKVSEVSETIEPRFPPPPHTTSLLQQDAFYKCGFSSKLTMKLAQDLYERGLITYHRTDSFNLSTQFVFKAKDYIEKNFGKDYSLGKPRAYRTKSKLAQEAHEAIRPTKLERDPRFRGDDRAGRGLTVNHQKLYRLIFDRAIATQMKEAQIKNIKIKILGEKGYLFQSEQQQVIFDGFLKLLNPDFVKRHQKIFIVSKDEILKLKSLEEKLLKTNPPPRYNEASLIKILEEKGIGRPSTYAPILSLIQDKFYVEKEFRYFKPTKLGVTISDYLSSSFPQIFNLDFTAHMEEEFDQIAENKINFISLLSEFNTPFKKNLEEKKQDTTTIDVEEQVNEKCPQCGSFLTIRYSKFGKFLACSNYPKCKFTKSFLKVVPNKKCPECSGEIVIRFTKTKKRFYGCSNWPKCKYSAWRL